MRPRRLPLALVSGLLVASLLPAQAGAADRSYSRAYLMADEGNEYYWSVDPDDPELSVGTISVQCGGTVWGTPDAKPCLHGTDINNKQNIFALFFLPATLFDAPTAWTSAEPIRFHLALHVTSPLPYTVHFGLQEGVAQLESDPATETAPDVWEGTLAKPGKIDGSAFVMPYVRIRTLSPVVAFDMKTAGRTWFDLPHATPGHSVPELLSRSTYHPEAQSFSTPQRSFTFNDSQWKVETFTGDLTVARSFDISLDRDAEFLYAWAEDYESPLVYDLAKGRSPESRKATEGLTLELAQNGERLDRTTGSPGKGSTTSSAPDVPAGAAQLTVTPVGTQASSAYKAYVLEVFGPRTLASFRETFTADTMRAVTIATCPAGTEPVPVTEEVTTFSVDLDWDTVAPGLPKWTLRYGLPGVGDFPCGEFGTGDRMRFTYPTDQVWWMGATTSQDSMTVSHFDTVFELKVRYAYTPLPTA
ncbi:MAG: hypothetical protein ABR600_07615 [Actinomycetota bacterium]